MHLRFEGYLLPIFEFSMTAFLKKKGQKVHEAEFAVTRGDDNLVILQRHEKCF